LTTQQNYFFNPRLAKFLDISAKAFFLCIHMQKSVRKKRFCCISKFRYRLENNFKPSKQLCRTGSYKLLKLFPALLSTLKHST